MSLKSILFSIGGVIQNSVYPVKSFSGNTSAHSSIYNYSFIDDEGRNLDLNGYKGKKLLIVNSASECSYTKQYSDLEVLNNKLKASLNVIAFPCNDFGRQEKASNTQIQEFCKINYGVTFNVFRKTDVKLTSEHQIFHWLCNAKLNGWNDQIPLWNFWKFLLDEEGKLIAVFPSRSNPLSKKLINLIGD